MISIFSITAIFKFHKCITRILIQKLTLLQMLTLAQECHNEQVDRSAQIHMPNLWLLFEKKYPLQIKLFVVLFDSFCSEKEKKLNPPQKAVQLLDILFILSNLMRCNKIHEELHRCPNLFSHGNDLVRRQ